MADDQKPPAERSLGGRPTTYNAQTATLIVEGMERLGTYSAAAGYGDLPQSTLRRWMENQPEFALDLERARGNYIKAKALALEALGNPEYMERQLQRIAASEYVIRQRQEISGPDGAPLRALVIEVPAAVLGGPSSPAVGVSPVLGHPGEPPRLENTEQRPQ